MANEDIEQKIKITVDTNANEASKEVNKLTDSVDNVTDAQTKSSKASKIQSDAIKELAPATTSAVNGLKSMGKAMWALVANPLGAALTAVAVVLGVLFLAFKSFTPIVDKVEQAFAALGAVVNVIKNTFIAVVTGTKSLSEAFGGLSGDMDEAAKRTTNLVKAQQDLDDVIKSQAVTTARNRAEINKLNVELKNRTLSEEERLKIADKIEKSINKDFEQRKKIAEQEVRLAREAIAIKAQFTADEIKLLKKTGDATKELAESRGGNYDEDYDRLNAALIASIQLEDEATTNVERVYNRRDKLEDDLAAKAERRQADATVRSEKAQAERQKELDRIENEKKNPRKAVVEIGTTIIDPQEEILAKKLIDDQKILADRVTQDAIAGYAKEVREEDAENAKIVAEAKEAQYKTNLGNLQTILALGGKKLAAISKGLAIMDIVRSAYNSISSTISNIGIANAKAAAASPLTGGMPFVAINTAQGALSIGATIASSAMSIKSILGDSKSVSRSGASNSGGSGASSGASATPQVNFQGSKENQIGNTLAGKINEQAPIRVTVLENDITKVQAGVQAKVVSNSF